MPEQSYDWPLWLHVAELGNAIPCENYRRLSDET